MNRSVGNGEKYRWAISAASVLVVIGALGFGRFGYTMILPAMQQRLGLSAAQAGDLAAANMAGYLILSVVGGFLAMRFGARLVISLSLFVVAASMAATGMASGYRGALFGRFLTGLGSGGANVPIMGLVAAWFVAKRRGLAAGIAVSGSSFGLLITGLLIPVVLRVHEPDGWRASWYYLAAMTAVIGIIAVIVLRNPPAAESDSAVGTVPGSEHRLRRRNDFRRDYRRVLASGPLWILSVIYITFGFSYVIYATFFARGLIAAGFSEARAGALWSGVGAASIASGFIWGSVSDRTGRRFALALIYALQGCSFLVFGVCQLRCGNPAGYYVSGALFALTAWSIPAVMAAAAGDLLGPALASAAFGIITLFFGFGQILGPFVAGRLAQATGTYGSALLLAGGVAFLGAVLSATLIPRRLD